MTMVWLNQQILLDFQKLWGFKTTYERKRCENLVAESLLEEVLHILKKAEEIFDILEYLFVPSLQFALPAFYKLQNFWSELSATDTAAGCVLKRNLVTALDSEDITGLHDGASYLDPSLKGFSFVKDAVEWCNLSEQAADGVKHHAMEVAKVHVYPIKEPGDSDVEVLENDDQERETSVEHTNKRAKYDPLVEFRNATSDGGPI